MSSPNYYAGINRDLLDQVPLTARRVLEIGCASGAFGRAYLARNPTAHYVGVELFAEVASEAERHLSEVIVGDIESPEILRVIAKKCADAPFDVLVCGDVLEHLRDPWTVMAQLRLRVAVGGACILCIPNVANWRIVCQQLQGRWDYADAGLLDRTHLRFFTRDTAAEMVNAAGWTALDATPAAFMFDETEAAVAPFLFIAGALGADEEELRSNLSTFQWIIRAVNGPAPDRLYVAALGIEHIDGVFGARVGYPLSALATQPAMVVAWGQNSITLPSGWTRGVFVLHRLHTLGPENKGFVKTLISQGSIIVLDFDDDPRHWADFKKSDFYLFRYVHAVTVSTESLAELVRQWNPNVQVLPNAISELPQVSSTTPKHGERVRIFFGAINRIPEWVALLPALTQTLDELAAAAEMVVVHDKAFFDALPGRVTKVFYPTLPHAEYMEVLSTCDVALLPLHDTPFNRMKSDLKFIECCAAGVVPICSLVVYGDNAQHTQIGVFAEGMEEWQAALKMLCLDKAELARRRMIAKDYVTRERMHGQQVSARERYYRTLMTERPALEAQRKKRLRQFYRDLAEPLTALLYDHRPYAMLHISSGRTRDDTRAPGFPGHEWKVIRMDSFAETCPDMVGQALDLSVLADESLDAVFCDHNLVQLHSHEVPVALHEIRRVLTADGVLVINCPDWQAGCQLIDQGLASESFSQSIEAAGVQSTAIDAAYGRQALATTGTTVTHRCGFTEATLVTGLREVGFESIVSGSRAEPDFDLWVAASMALLSEAEILELADHHFPA